MSGLIALRAYQNDGISQVRYRIRTGKRRIVFVLPTGGGKTLVASHVIHGAVLKGSRVLFLAHRKELIKQAFCKLVRNGLDPSEIGAILAGVTSGTCLPPVDFATLTDDELWHRYARKRPSALVQVASIDTLRTKQLPEAQLVVIDECHRSLSAGYVRILRHYHAQGAVVLGLTATPVRSDGRGLGEPLKVLDEAGAVVLGPDGTPATFAAFEDLVVGATYSDLHQDGFLVDQRVWTIPAQQLAALETIKITGNDYDNDALAALMNCSGLVGDIVARWLGQSQGRPTVCFAVNRDHSRHIVERFCAAGVRALHVDANSDDTLRDNVGRRLRLPLSHPDRLDVVCNVDVFTEGWDEPGVSCVILARATKSVRIYLQQVGRGSRPAPGKIDCYVHDHAGCAIEHGMPQWPREWSLEGRSKKAKLKSPPTCVCEECRAVWPGGTDICTAPLPDGTICNWTFPPPPPREEIAEHAGELVEVRAATREEMLEAWEEILHARGKRKPGWCHHEFVRRFGMKPPRDFAKPDDGTPPLTDEELAISRALHIDRVVAEAIAENRPVKWARMRIGTSKLSGLRFPLNEELEHCGPAEADPVGFNAWFAPVAPVVELPPMTDLGIAPAPVVKKEQLRLPVVGLFQ
jgi:superfamily II DNA or RNA helicase